MFLYLDIYIKMYLHLVIITCGLAMLKKSVDQGYTLKKKKVIPTH